MFFSGRQGRLTGLGAAMKAYCHNSPVAGGLKRLLVTVAFFAVLTATLIAFVRPAMALEAVVTDVRVGEYGDATRLVFDLDNEVKFKIFTLSNPDRVVIDLPEVGWRLPTKPLPANVGILQKLRYGLFKPGVSRIVLDLKSASTVKRSFLLKPGATGKYRLIVDLKPAVKSAAARPLKSVPTPKKPAATALIAAKRVIVIDPGHGGIDPGTIGVDGFYEKRITLAMALELKKRLEQDGRYKVVLTRSRDTFIKLRDRVAIARNSGADLFLSLHADAMKNHRTRGLSVYTLSEKASDREAAALAEQENKADLIAGVNLSKETPEVTNILIDLAQRETMNQSTRIAADLVKELRRETRVLHNSHRFAGFAVLKAPDVPSVLIELGFLSNRADEKALRSKAYRRRLADGIVRAIGGYFSNVEEAYRK